MFSWNKAGAERRANYALNPYIRQIYKFNISDRFYLFMTRDHLGATDWIVLLGCIMSIILQETAANAEAKEDTSLGQA
jgi:hypothetical protein